MWIWSLGSRGPPDRPGTCGDDNTHTEERGMTVSRTWLRAVFAVVAVAIGLAANLEAQSQPARGGGSIVLGTVELHLQMSESQVIKGLSTEFELREHSMVGPDSSWQVCEKNVDRTHLCVGSVVFENRKLVEATRRWPEAGTPASFAESLHTIARKFVVEGHRACRLDVVAVRDQFSTDDSTVILCGQKQIRIGFISTDPQAPPYIVEVLQDTGQ
jgi:hypothetical protein